MITSASNSIVKRLRRLANSSKARREDGQYMAEGIHLVKSYLASGGIPSMYVLAQSASGNSEIADLVSQLDALGVRRVVLADSLLESVASVHASVGLVIMFTPKPAVLNDTMPLTAAAVMLDDVQDPGNMGTILRTAAAVGVGQVLLSPGCASPWSPKALRAGMGAQFALDICEDVDLVAAIDTTELPVLASALSDDAGTLYDTDLSHPVVWVFGSEGQGVSAAVQTRADIRITIPQVSGSVESLNVSAAAAVCLYESYRQSRQAEDV